MDQKPKFKIISFYVDLNAFLLDKDIDTVLVSETHLTDKSFVSVPGYTIYNHPSNKAHRATAIIITAEHTKTSSDH